jgi:PadR family transcriptional regulator PadR
MDIQLKKGLLEICVLAELLKGDSYGYQIIKDVSHIVKISESTLYPILRRLENKKCLETYSVEHDGKLRKYYKITKEGKTKIDDFCDEWSDITKIINHIRGMNL